MPDEPFRLTSSIRIQDVQTLTGEQPTLFRYLEEAIEREDYGKCVNASDDSPLPYLEKPCQAFVAVPGFEKANPSHPQHDKVAGQERSL